MALGSEISNPASVIYFQKAPSPRPLQTVPSTENKCSNARVLILKAITISISIWQHRKLEYPVDYSELCLVTDSHLEMIPLMGWYMVEHTQRCLSVVMFSYSHKDKTNLRAKKEAQYTIITHSSHSQYWLFWYGIWLFVSTNFKAKSKRNYCAVFKW